MGDPQELVDSLGEGGSRELLAILMRPQDDRFALISQLYGQDGARRELAETLIDLEADDARRWEVMDALRAIVPTQEPPS